MANDQLTAVIKKDENTAGVIMQSMSALDIAKTWVIDSPETAEAVSEERNAAQATVKTLEGLYKTMVKPAQEIIELARDWFKPGIDTQKAAIEHYNGLLIEWDAKETARIAAENAKREAEVRRARQEAEAAAAALRAKAEQEAANRLREAQAAEADRAKAEAEGNAKAAEEAAARAAQAAEQAQAAISEGAHAAAQVQEAAIVAAPVMEQKTSVAGTTFRKNYVAVMALPTESEVIKAIAAAIPSRPDLIGLLSVNMSAANKMAKALEDNFNVPGLRSENQKVAAKAKGGK